MGSHMQALHVGRLQQTVLWRTASLPLSSTHLAGWLVSSDPCAQTSLASGTLKVLLACSSLAVCTGPVHTPWEVVKLTSNLRAMPKKNLRLVHTDCIATSP